MGGEPQEGQSAQGGHSATERCKDVRGVDCTEASLYRAVKCQGRDPELDEPSSTQKSGGKGQAEAALLLGEG